MLCPGENVPSPLPRNTSYFLFPAPTQDRQIQIAAISEPATRNRDWIGNGIFMHRRREPSLTFTQHDCDQAVKRITYRQVCFAVAVEIASGHRIEIGQDDVGG